MAQKNLMECEFSLVRYVPDPVKNEFVNIGVVLRDASAPERTVLRMTQDWTRARCIHPQVDVDYLEGLEGELRPYLAQHPRLLEQLRTSWSTVVEITPPKGCMAETFMTQLDQLMRLYVERKKQPKEKGRGGRSAVFAEMRRQFEREGVWDMMVKKIAVSKYTMPGDPLQIDCGYRTNGTMKMFHAISLDTNVEVVAQLAHVSQRLVTRVKEVENAKLELTAIVEPVRDVASNQEQQDRYKYGYKTMEDQRIRVLTMSALPRIAATARGDLRIP